MAAGPDRSQKTEKPTPRRKREAREKGQIARSPDLTTWLALLATTVLIQTTITRGAIAARKMLAAMGAAAAEPDVGNAGRFFLESLWDAAIVVAPLVLGLLVIVIVTQVGQVGLKPSLKRLKPQFSRLNVLKGLKRLVGANAWWEVAKGVAKVAILVAVAWPAASHAARQLAAGGGMDRLVSITAKNALLILRNVSVAGLTVAAGDYLYQYRRVMKEISMTKQEVRDEHRQHEGDPHVRQAIRSRQAAISRNRMIQLVSDADVVVVNPTHYAVAIRYEATRGAPEVVAKGAGLIAARIRTEAEKHGVPIVREPVLTRALFKSCDIGSLVPIDLYEAVAHLLAFIFALRARGRAAGYHEFTESLVPT